MSEHRWAPPSHPDPPEDQPLGIEAPPTPDRVSEYPAVWVQVEFTRSDPQTCPGFVERADGDGGVGVAGGSEASSASAAA